MPSPSILSWIYRESSSRYPAATSTNPTNPFRTNEQQQVESPPSRVVLRPRQPQMPLQAPLTPDLVHPASAGYDRQQPERPLPYPPQMRQSQSHSVRPLSSALLTPDPSYSAEVETDYEVGDQARSEQASQWGAGVDPDNSKSVISEEPPMSPGMSYMNVTIAPTMTTFPNVRGPNLTRLKKVYYRLLTNSDGPCSSMYAMHADDPSLSFVYAQHVPPPGLASNYITYICGREQLHPSRVKLYISTREIGMENHEAQYTAVKPTEKIVLQEGGRGLNEGDPLLLSVELAPGKERKVAAEPLPVWVEGGRVAAVAGGKGLSAFGTCVIAVARCVASCPTQCPRSFCGGFRTCWIETWTCGNPSVYMSRPTNNLLCCCCWPRC